MKHFKYLYKLYALIHDTFYTKSDSHHGFSHGTTQKYFGPEKFIFFTLFLRFWIFLLEKLTFVHYGPLGPITHHK